MRRFLSVSCLLALLPLPLVAQVDINTAYNVDDSGGGYIFDDIGWEFTPTIDMMVNSFSTIFGPTTGADRDVFFQLMTAPDGTVLGSTSFNSGDARGSLGGGTFSAISLVAGDTYFLGLLNVGGLENFVDAAGRPTATSLHEVVGDAGLFDYDVGFPLASSKPIIELGVATAPTTTPEPSSMILLATGLLALIGLLRMRRAASLG